MAITIAATVGQAGITDTQFDDAYVVQTGVITSTNPLTSIGGVAPVAGVITVPVSATNLYGQLIYTVATGAYTYTPSDAAVEPLAASVTAAINSLTIIESVTGTTATLGFAITVNPLGTTGDTIGNDTITGTAAAEKFDGLDGNDSISGLAGVDSLVGGLGNDTLDGGAGADIMTGNGGDDVYIVDDAGDVVNEVAAEGTDTVQSSITYALNDGTSIGADNLTLTGTTAIDGTGNSIANLITGNSAANKLDGGVGIDTMVGGAGDDSYAVDALLDVVTENAGEGWDAVTTTVVGTIALGTATTLAANAEVLIIGAGATEGIGNAGNNYLLGNAGNNVLDGKAGADVMAGYAGNDAYTVDNIGDVVIENAAEGTDTVTSSVSYTLGANIENLTLSNPVAGSLLAAFEATGNTLANNLTGNDSNNVLNGGAGVDAMTGGDGNDTYFVDNIGDTVVELLVGARAGAGTADLVYSTADTFSLGAAAATDGVENLVVWGTTGITGNGNSLNNIIYGQSLNNILTDGAGSDVLVGGRGQDTINLAADVTTDTVYIAAGDSMTTGMDIVTGFTLLAGTSDNLNLDSTIIAANVVGNNGTDAGAIQTNSVANGIITFQGAGATAISATSLVLADAIAYVQANITGGQTVGFAQGADFYVFQDGGVNANDTVVDLVGIAAGVTSVGTTSGVAGAVWII